MSLNSAEINFIKAVKAGIHGENAMIKDADYSALFETAMQQKLLPFVFEAVRKTSALQQNQALFAAEKQQVINQVLSQTLRSAEFEETYKKFLEEGLRPIVVKGRICSRLYPLRDHRLSADDDIFVSENDFLPCHNILMQNGFTADCPENELLSKDEVSYTKENGTAYIEMHRRLFDSSKDMHDDLNGFFDDAHAHLMSTEGFFTMNPHDNMLYLILHAYKHFVCSGIGIRQFCDIGLWSKNYTADIDWPLLYEQCQKVRAAKFAAAIFKIANEYLGIEFDLPQPWSESDISCVPLLKDSICGGIYGSNDYTRLHSSTITLNAVRSGRDGKRRGILSSVFPPKRYMENKYSYVKRHSWLLPAAWGQRIVRYIRETAENKDDSAAESVKLAKKRIELMKTYDII